jgi:hypothetical protein
MKSIAYLLLVLLCFFISTPVSAGSFGISPVMANIQIEKGAFADLKFTIIGYSGLVEISSENMPVTISPKSVNAVDSLPITVTVKCNDDAIPGLYNGKLVFLAKSGNSVQSGIKVLCNLTVVGATTTEEQPVNPIMFVAWLGLLIVLLIGIIYLSRRVRNV